MTKNIEQDEEGFPKSDEFYIPILNILKEGNYTEEEISNKLCDYFDLNEEQINQKVTPRNNNDAPNTKLKSHTHFAIANFEILDCVKKENNIYSIDYRGEEILNIGIKKLKKNQLGKIVSRLDLIRILGIISALKLDVSFLILTKNGHRGSQVDATKHFRDFLKRNNIHNYDNQEWGDDNKIPFPSYLFTNNDKKPFETSLYRTNSGGSPRMWFTGMSNYITPWSIFLFTAIDEHLYVFDLSDNFTLNSLLSQNGEPYEILKKESDKKFNENIKSFFKRLKKLNDKKYILLNSANPNINSILKKEDFNFNDCQKYEFEEIEFEVLNEKDCNKLYYDSDNILFNSILNENQSSIIEFKNQYFPNDSDIELSNLNQNRKWILENDYENGLLKVVDKNEEVDVLILDFEDILYNSNEEFNLIHKNINTNYGDEYVLFEKILSYSKPNFSLLSFFMMDQDFKSLLDINPELVLDIKLKEDLLISSLRLKLKNEYVLKKLFYKNVFNLKDDF